MSSRPLIKPHSVSTNHSMGATFASDPTIVQNLSMMSYQVVWSAGSTPVGILTVEVSNTYSQNGEGAELVAGTWAALPGISIAVSGNSGNAFIDIGATGAYAIRLKYTRTSGSGTINAVISAKVA